MSLTYVPGDAYAHRLDPRTKLAVQAAFAVAAVAHTTPWGLAVLTLPALGAVRAAGGSVARTLWAYRAAVPFLVAAPLVEGFTWGGAWFVPADALSPALAGWRALLLLLVGGAYVRSTPIRESRAAIQWLLPGRVGVVCGAGIGFLMRFLPVLRRDLATIRSSMHARLAAERSLLDRIRLVGVTGLRRVFRRADGVSLALRARCFAWNPTLPRLSAGRQDVPALALAIALVAWGMV
ncbi:energy-coupling factor transporter transmembrane component T family protein [Halomarina litorea]|uniref:energy-coupling factor transporter transmembrane component T family protein n=1 Tax=Halomarina litorea TaxID=2961595 RepID=UPI0020C2F32C|nr:energy-coupling factor transporter transmembrane component T [Halomarina sp. BCD28]